MNLDPDLVTNELPPGSLSPGTSKQHRTLTVSGPAMPFRGQEYQLPVEAQSAADKALQEAGATLLSDAAVIAKRHRTRTIEREYVEEAARHLCLGRRSSALGDIGLAVGSAVASAALSIGLITLSSPVSALLLWSAALFGGLGLSLLSIGIVLKMVGH